MASNPEVRAAFRQERKEFLRVFRGSHACTDCGIQYPWYVMDLDHPLGNFRRRPSGRRLNWDQICGSSWSTLQRELEKVEVVCANCHKIREHTRGNYGIQKTGQD